jgi:prevent-host-death family protein
MQKIIGATEFERKFRPFFENVVRKRTPLILTRGSRPEAALIPYEDYLRYQQMHESEVLARFGKVWDRLAAVNAEFSEEEIRFLSRDTWEGDGNRPLLLSTAG